ncbi:MAG: hypothetical protein R3E89_17370 [Thiolinea sp.]
MKQSITILQQLAESATSNYLHHGENKTSIEYLEQQARHSLRRLLQEQDLQYLLTATEQTTRQTGMPQACQTIEQERLHISLHALPAQSVIPAHHHPHALNLMLMLHGEALVTRFSAVHGQVMRERLLQAGDSDAGLQHYLNLHRVEARSPVCIFLSLRCEVKPQNRWHPLQRLLLTPLLCCGLLLPVYPITACSESSYATSLETAHHLRTSGRTEAQLQQAFRLYKIAAEQGEAEAQYWLAYMYIMAMGTPRNEKQAIRWAFRAEQQNYPPAAQLLDDLLQGRFDERIPQC